MFVAQAPVHRVVLRRKAAKRGGGIVPGMPSGERHSWELVAHVRSTLEDLMGTGNKRKYANILRIKFDPNVLCFCCISRLFLHFGENFIYFYTPSFNG